MGSQATLDRPVEVRCGACKGRHASRHEVKACYAAKREAEAEERYWAAEEANNDALEAELAVERILEEGTPAQQAEADLDRLVELWGPPAL